MADFSLRDIVMFSQLTGEALERVTHALKTRELEKGEILFNKDDPGDELILVKEGAISIFTPEEEDKRAGQAIRIFEPGDLLGEMALIEKKPRSASARAEVPSIVLIHIHIVFQGIVV